MTRRKRKRVGGSFTQKPQDLREAGPVSPVTVRLLSDDELRVRREELELRHAERDRQHAARTYLRHSASQAS